jgi:hypothetical protein
LLRELFFSSSEALTGKMSFEMPVDASGESQRSATGDAESPLELSPAPVSDYVTCQCCVRKAIEEGGLTIGTRPPQAKVEDLLAMKEPNSLEIASWRPWFEDMSATPARSV